MKQPPARPPAGLQAAGKRLWTTIHAAYLLSPGEAETLRQACLCADLIARIDAEIAALPDLVVAGHAGQPRPHPMLAAGAEQRRVLAGLIRSLALPMPAGIDRLDPAKVAAAQARWRRQRRERERGAAAPR